MRLAAHNFSIVIGQEVQACLRPSLRAAFNLFFKYSVADLIRHIATFELGVIKEVIEAGSDVPNFRAADALAALCRKPLGDSHQAISDTLISFVIALTGAD